MSEKATLVKSEGTASGYQNISGKTSGSLGQSSGMPLVTRIVASKIAKSKAGQTLGLSILPFFAADAFLYRK